MKKPRTQKQIDEMRQRLYDRGAAVGETVRHELSDTPIDVARDWDAAPPPESAETTDLRQSVTTVAESPAPPARRRYRQFVLGGSLFIFILVAAVSSAFLYFGGNQISSDNIQIAIEGQPLIGGGEVLPLQIAVANQNTVTIESATLILKYPIGTRSVGDTPRTLFEERIPLNDIAPGEVQNVPVRVAVFGEENDEKEIHATIEYRVNGSNGMFYKDADPLAFRISSSPLVLRIEGVEKVASGQEVTLTVTAVSNASSPLEDVLITASFPNGFRFQGAEPAPVYGQNVWRIAELLPEQTTDIEIEGIITGLTEETFRINFDAGPADPDNQYLVGAVLAEAHTEFVIERPFIDVAISISGDTSREVVLAEGQSAGVNINLTNTLDETVYDMAIEVVPGGNALDEDSIQSSTGFYDSNRGTVRWEVANNESFERILPGQSRALSFSINPGAVRTTASFDLVVNVYARRVAESSAQETLIGTSRAEAKYSASVALGSQAGRGGTDTGPVPPAVGETSTYTLTLVAEAGANDLANAIVETSLPLHIDWLDDYTADGTLTYNTVSKQLEWDIGDIAARERKTATIKVGFLPSSSQVGTTPVLLNRQSIRANDRFTSARLQDDAPAVTTELSTEMGFSSGNGEVTR